MSWEKINEMFPLGYTVAGDSVPIEEIIKNNYDVVTGERNYMARDMKVAEERIEWYKNNTIERTRPYDLVHPNDQPYYHSCLNVYGKRMLIDAQSGILRNADGTRNNIKQEQELESEELHAGFNYTGL